MCVCVGGGGREGERKGRGEEEEKRKDEWEARGQNYALSKHYIRMQGPRRSCNSPGIAGIVVVWGST